MPQNYKFYKHHDSTVDHVRAFSQYTNISFKEKDVNKRSTIYVIYVNVRKTFDLHLNRENSVLVWAL